MIDGGELDPIGFVGAELIARGGLVDRTGGDALVVLPAAVAARLVVPEVFTLAEAARPDAIGCGFGAPLLDLLTTEVRATVPVATVIWSAEPARAAVAERVAARLVARNGVVDVIGTGTAAATYLIGVFAWSAEADDRYQGMVTLVAQAATGGEPDDAAAAALMRLVSGADPRAEAGAAIGDASAGLRALADRLPRAIGVRLDEVGAAVGRRAERERSRLDSYFTSLIGEARRPRRQVANAAIAARVAALEAEHAAKLRDLATRYAVRVKLEPIALIAVAARVAEVRVRLRRRKGERELALQLPPTARTFDALACVACPATTRAPVLCDDALHLLCEACAPEVTGRPRCPACLRPAPRPR